MSSAPALPAQTPAMFVGGGGQGSGLQGECAEATADCGLTSSEFGPMEQVTSELRAAHDSCARYDRARHLEEVPRAFETEDTEARSDAEQADELRPSARTRHLSRCAAGSPQHPALFEDRAVAPAVPHHVGLTPRVSAPTAVSTLVPELRFVGGDPAQPRPSGQGISPRDMTAHRHRCIRQVLRDARDEDRPRLRSTDLMGATRPRQEESERRFVEQALPEPPSLARSASGEAEGASADPDAGDDLDATSAERRAEGCVAAAMEAQESEMEQDIARQLGDDRPATEREAHSDEREARQRAERASRDVAEARRAERSEAMSGGDRASLAKARVSVRAAVTDLGRAQADRASASDRVAKLPALRALAAEVQARPAGRSSERRGRLPDVRTPAPTQPAMDTVTLSDG